MAPDNMIPIPDAAAGKEKEKKGPGKKQLAIDRARLAQERTLLAWVRTATTFMTFGFALFKFLEAQLESTGNKPLRGLITPRDIGGLMLLTGLVGLVIAVYRHYHVMRLLDSYARTRFFTPVLLQAYTVICLIILLLYGAYVH
jgi:putative membrane protein